MLELLWDFLKLLWSCAKQIYRFLGKAIVFMSKYPLGILTGKIKKAVAEHLPVSQSLDQRFRSFNGFYPFLLFSISLLFTVIFLLWSIPTWQQEDNIFIELLYNTTIGSFIGLVDGGLEFAPDTLVAIAFSGHLMSLCMDTHDRTVSDFDGTQITIKPKRYIRAICYLTYLMMTAIVAMLLSNVFQSVGEWAAGLYGQQTDTFWTTAGKILLLIPLGYFSALLWLITIREYAESFFFGILGMLAISIILSLLAMTMDTSAAGSEFLITVLFILLIPCVDGARNYAVEKFEASCK